VVFIGNYIVSCLFVDVSMEIAAIKTRVCPNCGKMFDSVGEKWLHTSHCNAPFTAPSNCYLFFIIHRKCKYFLFSEVTIRKSNRKSKPRVVDNFVNCGILATPVKIEAEPEVLLEVVSLANNTNHLFQSELVKSTRSQEAAIGQYVLIDRDLDLSQSRSSDASIPVGASSTFSRCKTDQPASKGPLKARYNPQKRKDASKPTDASSSIRRAKKSDQKGSAIASKAKEVPKKRLDKATIADLMKLPDLLKTTPNVKKAKVKNPLVEVHGGKKKNLNHKCSLCGLAVVTPSKLARHMMSHKHDLYKRFNCQECGKGFIRKDYLVAHFSKVHLSLVNFKKQIEGSLKCDHCPTVFKSKSRMTHHVKSNHSTFGYQ